MFFHEGTQCDQSCPFNRTDFLPNILRDLEWSTVGGIVFTVLGQILIVQIGPPNTSHRQFTQVRKLFFS